MKKLSNGVFEGERALFFAKDLEISDSIFQNGESPLKESSNIKVNNCTFSYKYPLWYSKNIVVNNSTFNEMSRSGIWYTEDINLLNSIIYAPKEFRRSKKIIIKDCNFLDAKETLWECENVNIINTSFKDADYLLMNSKDIYVENIRLDGNYFLDGSKNIVVKNSILNSKDSFWNCENVTVENSIINGEYIGWNSKNMTFINCEIESLQGFCYIENLKLINCKFKNTTLAFEYTTLDAKIIGKVDSIKNPMGGKIEVDDVGKLILDENIINPGQTKIIIKK